MGLKRVMGWGNYRDRLDVSAQSCNRAMVRPGRDRLAGVVEVDEAYWGEGQANGRGAAVRVWW